jgi:predicted phosphodiesterase
VTRRIEIDGFRIYVLHILAELDPQAADNVDAVIYGHSHQPKIETKNGTLFFNPGSAGPRRFRLPLRFVQRCAICRPLMRSFRSISDALL